MRAGWLPRRTELGRAQYATKPQAETTKCAQSLEFQGLHERGDHWRGGQCGRCVGRQQEGDCSPSSRVFALSKSSSQQNPLASIILRTLASRVNYADRRSSRASKVWGCELSHPSVPSIVLSAHSPRTAPDRPGRLGLELCHLASVMRQEPGNHPIRSPDDPGAKQKNARCVAKERPLRASDLRRRPPIVLSARLARPPDKAMCGPHLATDWRGAVGSWDAPPAGLHVFSSLRALALGVDNHKGAPRT